MPVFQRQRWEDFKFKVSLSHTVSSRLNWATLTPTKRGGGFEHKAQPFGMQRTSEEAARSKKHAQAKSLAPDSPVLQMCH